MSGESTQGAWGSGWGSLVMQHRAEGLEEVRRPPGQPRAAAGTKVVLEEGAGAVPSAPKLEGRCQGLARKLWGPTRVSAVGAEGAVPCPCSSG